MIGSEKAAFLGAANQKEVKLMKIEEKKKAKLEN